MLDRRYGLAVPDILKFNDATPPHPISSKRHAERNNSRTRYATMYALCQSRKPVMMTKSIVALLLTSALVLGGCEQGRQKETAGTVLGGVGGALLGSQFGGGTGRLISTAVGTLAGAFIGNQIGAGLDKADQAQMVQA